MSHITVVATISPKPDTAARAMEVLQKLATDTQANEPGCSSYQVYKYEGGDEFIVLETFKDTEALKAHSSAAHFKEAEKVMVAEELLSKDLDIKVLSGPVAGFAGR